MIEVKCPKCNNWVNVMDSIRHEHKGNIIFRCNCYHDFAEFEVAGVRVEYEEKESNDEKW